MSVTINGTNGLTFNDASTQNTAATGFGFKNRIINGAMMIDQRNAGASVTPVNQQYTIDRWQAELTQTGKFSVQQNAGSVTPPTGFTSYLGVTSLSAYSITSTDQFDVRTRIEGNNLSDIGFGTANAQPVTLSFWVRSSLTGTFGGSIGNQAITQTYPFTYTINASNTWEYKTISISGSTTGVWNLGTNSNGMDIRFNLGAGATYSAAPNAWSSSLIVAPTGATSVVGTNGATFYITGVQLEKGSTATSFDYRPYGTELALCQRYCYNMNFNQAGNAYALLPAGANQNTGNTINFLQLPVSMRTAPNLTWSGTWSDLISGASGTAVSLNGQGNTTQSVFLNFSPPTSGAFTAGAVNGIRINNSNTWYALFSAEL